MRRRALTESRKLESYPDRFEIARKTALQDEHADNRYLGVSEIAKLEKHTLARHPRTRQDDLDLQNGTYVDPNWLNQREIGKDLREALTDPHPSVRDLAAQALARVKDPQGFQAAVELLDNKPSAWAKQMMKKADRLGHQGEPISPQTTLAAPPNYRPGPTPEAVQDDFQKMDQLLGNLSQRRVKAGEKEAPTWKAQNYLIQRYFQYRHALLEAAIANADEGLNKKGDLIHFEFDYLLKTDWDFGSGMKFHIDPKSEQAVEFLKIVREHLAQLEKKLDDGSFQKFMPEKYKELKGLFQKYVHSGKNYPI